ncbi:protein PrnX [Paecilomyces variotii No. 5]|uniref:Protein PrnX n=1 Tax=Byssochlamys spectabilis (strain No. 5 / NBRC 109023) TaxID=1356009 RepID=V5G2X1_BYSSN|nr:protein PrnX [Paecilomyces variotii No. 5]
MRLLPEGDLSRLLRSLTQEQCHRLLHVLTESLSSFSAQSTSGSSEKLIHQPLRSHIVTKGNDTSLFMPSSNNATTGIKIVTIPGDGGEIAAVINIFTPNGKLTGLLSAAEVTAFRTALATMTLFTRCSSLKRENIVIFGSGKQAEWHARLAVLLLPQEVKKITFVNRGRQRLERIEKTLLAELRERYPALRTDILAQEGTSDYAEKLQLELAASDVICCCTPSTAPLFPYSYLKPQAGEVSKQRFISLIGSYKPHMQEIDTQTLLTCGEKIYVDSKEACLEESGELINAQVTEGQLIEIGELFGPGKETGSLSVPAGSNVVFKCVGMGIMDLVIANTLLEISRDLNIGTEMDGF